MSTKTKKLSQLLFRRSSTNAGSTNKPQFMGGGNNNKNSKEEDSDLSHLLIPQIVETTPKLVSHVIFSDKPLRPRRSYSPSKADPDARPVSILKNKIDRKNGRPITNGKTTLQRTKSNPNPPLKSKDISSSNPLQEVSWDCPTLEKRKEMILNYFKNISFDNNGNLVCNDKTDSYHQYDIPEHIYEEIQDPSGSPQNKYESGNNNTNMGSLKPKIAPKKIRLNIPPTNSKPNDDDNDDKPPPIYDKLLARSSSFNVYEDLQTIRGNKAQYLKSKSQQNSANNNNNNNNNNILAQGKDTVGLAHFASQVAQHAKANRSNSFSLSSKTLSKSSSSSSSVSSTSSSSGSSSNSSKLSKSSSTSSSQSNFDSYDFDMDQIYSKIDKRPQKLGTPTTRLLRKQAQNNPRYQNIPDDFQNDSDSNELNVLLPPPLLPTLTPTSNKLNTNTNAQQINVSEEQLNERQSTLKEQIEPQFTTVSPRTINTFAPGGGNDSSAEEEGNSSSSPTIVTLDSSSCYSSESESLLANQNHNHELRQKTQQPVRPPRGNRQSSAFSQSSSNQKASEKIQTSSQKPTALNKPIKITNTLFGNVQEKVEKVLPEKDLSANLSFKDGNNKQSSETSAKFLNLADVFPPFGENKNTLDNSSIIIDSTSSSPRSYPVPPTVVETKNPDDIVTVRSVSSSKPPRPAAPSLASLMEFNHKNNSGTDEHLLGKNYQNSHNNMTTEMNKSTEEVELPVSPNLLIETKETISIDKFFWESNSPNSPSQKSEGGSSTTSDLSDSSSSSSSSPETTMSDSVSTMEYNNASANIINSNSNKRETNPFIRQESKYYEDVDEDGGFESFQVADDSNYEDEGTEDHLSSGTPQSTSPDSGLTVANRDRTFAQQSQNIPENELKLKASSVLDLINAEISDLHMREMELKHKTQKDNDDESEDLAEGSSQADSDDYSDSAVDIGNYSPTSNSPDNLTPAESRNRGGSPYSAASDHESGVNKLEDFVDATDGHGGSGRLAGHGLEVINSGKTVSALATEDEKQQQQGGKVRPIVEEEEVKSIELNMTKETPIEREIRLVREREEEFRRHRSLSATTSIEKDEHQDKRETISPITTPNGTTGHTGPKSVKSVVAASSVETKPTVSHHGAPKDLQYEMATARLKREIEESLMRERELYREGRLKTISVSESVDESEQSEKPQILESDEDSSEETSHRNERVVEDHNILPSAGRRPLAKLSISTPPQAKTDEVKSSTPSSGSHAVRFFTPAAYNSASPNSASIISPVLSPITNPGSPSFPTNTEVFRRGSFTNGDNSPTVTSPTLLGQHPHQQTHSLPMNLAKPQFTGLERMILKGSFSFNKNLSQEPKNMMHHHHEEQSRMNKTSRMPDPLQIVHRTESIEETEEREAVEVAKPRRKYVPAQDKIQLELQEQNKRETELSQLRAKWKSTPDLSKSSEEQSENSINSDEMVSERSQEAESLTKPSYLRRQRSASTQKINEEVSTSDVLRMNKPTVRRRQSALINQWEEMIKQQQQKNKN